MPGKEKPQPKESQEKPKYERVIEMWKTIESHSNMLQFESFRDFPYQSYLYKGQRIAIVFAFDNPKARFRAIDAA